ncbi:MAG: hypothetical protein ACFFD1_02050, partial [Candidatus Thorarchaeota archaeon]
EKEKTFVKQKSKNSELLANFRAKMNEIRSNENDDNLNLEEDFDINMDEKRENPEYQQGSKRNSNFNEKRRKNFSLRRPFFSKKRNSKRNGKNTNVKGKKGQRKTNQGQKQRY